MVHSTVVPFTDCVVDPGDGSGNDSFEPGAIANRLPKEFHMVSKQLIVLISDGEKNVLYDFEIFIAKSYPIRNGRIKFGSKIFRADKISLIIGLNFKVEDLSAITDFDLD